MAKATEIATTGSKDIAVILNINQILAKAASENDAAVYEGGEEDAGRGMEKVGMHERRIPILRILDPKSPQCKPVANGGIPGARGGTIFNTSTGQTYDGERGLYIIAAFRDEKYPCYIKREEDGSGGGFVGIHDPDDPIVKKRQNERLAEDGNLFGKLQNGTTDEGKILELVQTFYLYCVCIVPNADGTIPAIETADMFRAMIPFSSTQIKKYTSFIERHTNILYPMRKADGGVGPQNPAIWSHLWRITTTYESKGSYSWFGWVIKLAVADDKGIEHGTIYSRLDPKGPLYVMGRDLHALCEAGEAAPEYAKDTAGAEGTPRGPNSGGGGGSTSDDIPFGQTAG